MKFLLIAVIILNSCLPATGKEKPRPTEHLKIIFAAGMAEIKQDNRPNNLPKLSAFLNDLRKNNEHVLFFHGGAALSPSILSSFDRGAHMVTLLNALEPDLFAVAKNEFTFKEDELTLRTTEANFPFINSNLIDPLTGSSIEGVLPTLILKVGHYAVGVMALVDTDVITDYMPERITPADTMSIIYKYSHLLRKEGADLIFLLADFQIKDAPYLLTQKIVDFILINGRNIIVPFKGSDNYYELNDLASVVSMLDITLMDDGDRFSWTNENKAVSLADFPEDRQVTALITSDLQQISGILNTVIGETLTPIDTRRNSVRSRENGFCNYIADTIRDFYRSDIALINGGGVRGNREYPPGSKLTRGDIHREIPFRNHVVNIEITGRQLLESLENGLSGISELKGRFPHVSGITVQYNPKNPPGRRVVRVTVAGKPLDPEKSYTMATLDYLAGGGDGYSVLKNCKHLAKVRGGRLLWEYVRDRIVEQKTISPVTDGRMKILVQNKQ
ncbi:bifunctional metallophosphatase/5'-nucleotidase [Desulfomarina sp.]